jgi:hypothetical protein
VVSGITDTASWLVDSERMLGDSAVGEVTAAA